MLLVLPGQREKRWHVYRFTRRAGWRYCANTSGLLGHVTECRTWPPLLRFYERVRNGGVWDYKQQKRAYADFGNFHYGAVGYAACIPAKILHIAAGAAQWKAGTSEPKWGNFTGGPPFGDDPIDQFWIRQGIDYVKQHHY